MDATLFDGIAVELGGKAYTVPPLSFKGLRDSRDNLRKISDSMESGAGIDPAQLQEACSSVIHAALLRNYPGIGRDELDEALDWRTAMDLFNRVMEASLPKGQPGETRAESPSGASTGT